MSSALIADPEALGAAVHDFQDADRIGVDIEGDGLYRYRTRLCMAQLAMPDREAVIDTLALVDLSPLSGLLLGEGPLVVVHDVSFDSKILATRGLGLSRVFDTSVAVRYLGEPNTGLAAILEKFFGVVLEKSHQQADWGERPLTEEQHDYLLSDVRHLVPLSEKLEAMAEAADIIEEIEEETQYALRRSLIAEPEKEPWTRIKGARTLNPSWRSLLKSVADARERAAQEADVPPFRIAHNRAIFEAVRRRPKTAKLLRRARGMQKLSETVLAEAMEEAEHRGPLRAPPPPAAPPPEERRERKARARALGAWRDVEAAAREVDVQVVLPGHCLRDLGGLRELDDEGLRSIGGFGEKRLERYGEAIVRLLATADQAG